MFHARRFRTRFVRPWMFVSFAARPASRSTLDVRRSMFLSFGSSESFDARRSSFDGAAEIKVPE